MNQKINFCKWNYELHKNRPWEVTKELVDECFVKFCRLFKETVEEKNVFGKLSADGFEKTAEGIWTYKGGKNEMEYCPADGTAELSTDMFALGLILYELVLGKSFYNEKNIMPGLLFEFEDFQQEMKMKGKESALDETSVPKEYEEFGYILKLLTIFEQKQRLKSFDEFPAAEYLVESVESSSGRPLKSPAVRIVENLTDRVPVEKYIEKDGKRYELAPGERKQLEYTFLKRKIRLMYREV